MRIPSKVAASLLVVVGVVGSCADPPAGNRDWGTDPPAGGSAGETQEPTGGTAGALPEGGSNSVAGLSAGGSTNEAGGSSAAGNLAGGMGSTSNQGGSAGEPDEVGGTANSVGGGNFGGVDSEGGEGGIDTGSAGTTAGAAGHASAGRGGHAGTTSGGSGGVTGGSGGVAGRGSAGGATGGSGGSGSAGHGSGGAGPAVPVGENLFKGSSFESSGYEGWYARGTGVQLTVIEAVSRTGNQSLAVSHRTENWQGVEYDFLDLVVPGVSYSVSVWARLAPGQSASPLMLTRELQGCPGNQYMWLKYEPTVTDAAWVELRGTLKIPADCTPTKLVVYLESNVVDLSFLIDDVTAYELR